jgi:hypothetical protein
VSGRHAFAFLARVLGLACALAPRAARADTADAPPPSMPPLVLEGVAGGPTPVGRYGLLLDSTVYHGLGTSIGFGFDRLRAYGYDLTPLFAIMPRYRLAPWHDLTTISLGVGLSYGGRPPNGDRGTRLDAELSLERLFPGGLRVRAFGGGGPVLNPNDQATSNEKQTLYVGVGLGYAVIPNPSVSPTDSWSRGRWYDWQSLSLDFLAVYLMSGHDITFAGGDHLIGPHFATRAGVGTYCGSGPLVHYAHHNYGRIAASIVIRLLGVATGAAIGANTKVGDEGGNLVEVGAIGGAILGALVDDISLAWE